jgi:hypothetical protein
VEAELDHLARVGRIEGGELQGGQRGLGRRRQGGGLGPRVVADDGEHAAGGRAPDVVGVADGVGRPVEPGGLSVPHADNTIEAGRRHLAHQLGAQQGGGRQFLVHRRLVHDPVLGEDVGVPLQFHVQDAER